MLENGKGRKKGLMVSIFVLFLVPTVGSLDLPKGAVYPRIFTPNGDGVNDMVYFDLANPSLASVEAKIFDAGGGEVGDLRQASSMLVPPLSPDALVWDGKDRNGGTVSAGVYIYKIVGDGRTITGTVVVAK